MQINFKGVLGVLVAASVFAGCKKDHDLQSNLTPVTPATDKLKDSTLAYAKDIYLWYNQIPSTFNAQSHADPDKIMKSIRQYSVENGFSQPVDRWSFAINQKDWDNASSGVSGDFGMSVFFRADGDLRVKSVEKDSPAGRAGVRRGWRVTKINGSTNMATSNANFIINSIYHSNNAAITFQKPDNSVVDHSFTASLYQERPVLLDTIYSMGSNKIGYMVFNSFLGDTTQIYNDFNRVFNKFTQAGVNDLVVDLRYNGGGYVSVQQKLANYLVKPSANGDVMMKQEYNNKYSTYNSTVKFQKLGSLNLDRIFFIVSNSTASASELLINNLKPHMNVSLVGPNNTYGKPVGYFPIPVGSWYIFPVSFKSTNKNGEGAYFNGLPLTNAAADGLDKDWGDVDESSLASIIRYITTGVFRMQAAGQQPTILSFESTDVKQGNAVLDKENFKGTVDVRGLKRR